MRTTLNLDDDLLRVLRSMAEEEQRSIGEVVTDLVRKALAPAPATLDEGGFPIFDVSDAAPPLTLDRVRRALEDD
jgi:hypothetical protein